MLCREMRTFVDSLSLTFRCMHRIRSSLQMKLEQVVQDTLWKFGYSLRGKPVRAQKVLVCGEHVSAIAAISTKGLLALKIVREALMVTCSTTL